MNSLGIRALAVLACCAPLASAQEPHSVLSNGDLVAGQVVTSFTHAVVDDTGSWATTVLSDGPLMLVRDGARLLRVGEQITAPDAEVAFLYGPEGGGANLAVVALLTNVAFGPSNAVLRNGTAVLRTNDFVDAVGLPPDTLTGVIDWIAANQSGSVAAVIGISCCAPVRSSAQRLDRGGDRAPIISWSMSVTTDCVNQRSVKGVR
jgi:hypothetical protein